MKMPQKQVQHIFDINDDEDMMTPSSEQIERGAPADEDVLRTPPTPGHHAPTHDDQERPNGPIPSRASSTPGRDGEEE